MNRLRKRELLRRRNGQRQLWLCYYAVYNERATKIVWSHHMWYLKLLMLPAYLVMNGTANSKFMLVSI
jgi:hypothetical protein